MTSDYEQMPRWDCPHQWVNDGPAYWLTYGSDTISTFNTAGPARQKQRCMLCQGVQYVMVDQHHKWEVKDA